MSRRRKTSFLNFGPLFIIISSTITPTGRSSTADDNYIKPRPLHIKKVENSPSMPFRKRGRGRQEGKEEDRESNRGFLGKNMSPKPRVRGSSAGALGQDRDNGKTDGEGDFNDTRNLRGRKGAVLSSSGARMAWLPRPAAGQTESLSNHCNRADPYLCAKILSQWSPIIQKGTSHKIPQATPEGCLFTTLLRRHPFRG